MRTWNNALNVKAQYKVEKISMSLNGFKFI